MKPVMTNPVPVASVMGTGPLGASQTLPVSGGAVNPFQLNSGSESGVLQAASTLKVASTTNVTKTPPALTLTSTGATQRNAAASILRLWQSANSVCRDCSFVLHAAQKLAVRPEQSQRTKNSIVQDAPFEAQITATTAQPFEVLLQPLTAAKLKQTVSRFGQRPIYGCEGSKGDRGEPENSITYAGNDVSTTEHLKIWNDPLAAVTATLPVAIAFQQLYFITPASDPNSVSTDPQIVDSEQVKGAVSSCFDRLGTNEVVPVRPELLDKLGTQPGRRVNDETFVSAKKIIDTTTSFVNSTGVSKSGITRDSERIIEALKKVLGSSAELNVRRARNNSNKDRGDQIIVDTAIAGVPVELSFIRDGGGYIFGGWQDLLPSSKALVSGVERGTLAETYQDGRTPVLGLGRAGGEPHSSPQTIEARIEMQFVSLVMSQFSMEPSAQNIGRTLDAFNSVILRYSFPGFEKKITLEEWTGYLRETLKAAYSSSPAINEGGIRSNRAIQSDAAHILNIKRPLLTGWEVFLKAEDTTAQLLAGDKMSQKGADSGAQKRLLEALDKHMVGRAQGILDFPTSEFTFGIGRELKLEWQAARISAVKDSIEKIDRTVKQIEAFLSKDEIKMAGRFLALIFMNSDVNELPSAKDPIAPRWSESEVRSLLKVLCSNGTSAVVGHRWFRQYLSVRENRMVNLAIQGIDTEMTFSNIAQLNIDEASDAEFWAAVDNEPNLLNTAIARMAEMVH